MPLSEVCIVYIYILFLRYVVNAARAAKTNTSTPQRLVYISVCHYPTILTAATDIPIFQAGSADPSSRYLYLRSKGLTELDLAGLGYADTIVLRPGILAGTNRSESRIGESIAVYVCYWLLVRSQNENNGLHHNMAGS